VKIEILSFKGCPNHEPADLAVREVLAELGVRAQIVYVDVPDEAAAARIRFPGSPTIRVDGEDVVPAEDDDLYSLRCRVYRTTSGFSGVPNKQALRAAVERRMR
jgi:hypothetical protein